MIGTPSSTLRAVLTGRAVPYARPETFSAIAKQPVGRAVRIGTLGIEGDEQGDRRVHGGPDKAIHHYPLEHYAWWSDELGGSPLLDSPGAFGENFSSNGWTEDDVRLGDVVRAGSALLQVSQGRQPCWKLNDRFGRPQVARTMQHSGRTGWYYRVLEEGTVQAGDALHIVDRPHAEWSVRRLAELLFNRTLERDQLQAASTLPLPPSWKKILDRRLATATVESWDRRLLGP